MQFKVPQYIDVEDKIFGPFTFRQFAYMVGGAGLCYVSWNLLPGYLAFPAVIFFGGSAGALAFIKINEKPLINILEFWFGYTFKKKLYLWKRTSKRKLRKKKRKIRRYRTIYLEFRNQNFMIYHGDWTCLQRIRQKITKIDNVYISCTFRVVNL